VDLTYYSKDHGKLIVTTATARFHGIENTLEIEA